MRIASVTLMGATYPAAFSLRVAMEVAERYGSIDAVLERDLPPSAAIERKAWCMAQMLQAGRKAAKGKGEESPEPPSSDAILDGLDIHEADELNRAIVDVITADSEATVNLEEDPKNAEATQTV